jgi:hypothetical protein
MDTWKKQGSLLFLFCLIGVVMVLPAHVQGQSGLDAILEGCDDLEDVSSIHEESEHIDEVLNGFDEPGMSQRNEPGAEKTPFWDFFGYWKLLSVVNVNKQQERPFQGLTHLRGEFDLKLEIDIPGTWKARIGGNIKHNAVYRLKGRDDYSEEFIDDYETEIELREVYLQGNLTQNLDFKFGRQIVAWGVSESLRVVDVLNPLDLREIGMVDIEDLRLPVMLSRLDYYPTSRWTLTGIMIHEVRFHKEPPFGSDFYPGTEPLPGEEAVLDFSLAHQEFALAATGRFTGWDLSLHAAWVYDDNWHVEKVTEHDIQRKHHRLLIAGLTGQIARGNALFKGEAALINGLKFSSLPDQEKSRLDVLVGLEYAGFENTTISLEAVNRHLFEYHKTLSSEDIQRNQFQSTLRVVRDFYNDSVHIMLIASALGIQGKSGTLQRVQLEYEWADDLSIFLGATLYQSGDTAFSKVIQDNDRVFLEFKYNF